MVGIDVLASPRELMDRIRVTSSARHRTIKVTYRFLRWHITVDGHRLIRTWNSNDAVALGGFLASLAAPSTLIVSPGPRRPHGERREFGT